MTHLDDMHWEPGHYGIARKRERRDKLVLEAAATERWIMEGVYGQLANMVLDRVNSLMWLDLPEEECIAMFKDAASKAEVVKPAFRRRKCSARGGKRSSSAISTREPRAFRR